VIEPTKTEISQVIATQQIGSLPISGRQFTDFALLTPGVATSRTSWAPRSRNTRPPKSLSVACALSAMKSHGRRGLHQLNQRRAAHHSAPGIGAGIPCGEQQLRSGIRRALGGIVNIVSKSGTNDLHGSVYDYLQNSSADARSLLQPAPLPHQLKQTNSAELWAAQFTRIRLFLRELRGEAARGIPTYAPDLVNNIPPSMRQRPTWGSRLKVALWHLQLVTGTPIGYLNSFLKVVDNDYGFVRLDHQINANNRLGVATLSRMPRFGELVSQTLDGGGIGTPSGGRNLFIRDQSLVGTLDSSLKPDLINSALLRSGWPVDSGKCMPPGICSKALFMRSGLRRNPTCRPRIDHG